MINRRSLLCLFALLPGGLRPAVSEDWDGYGGRFRRRRRHRYGHRHLQDHEFARRALQEGRARPLADILTVAKDNIRGEVIGVELEERAGAMIYELRVLRSNGELVELYLDALTAAVLKQGGD
jgi:hypothetical protein